MKTLISKKNISEPLEKNRHASKASLRITGMTISSLSPSNMAVQRNLLCPCGGGCPRCVPAIQPKLKVGAPDDIYEQEADRVAEQVMRMPQTVVQKQPEEEEEEEELLQTKPVEISPQVQRQTEDEEEEEETVQTKQAGSTISLVRTGLESRINSMKGKGQYLPASTRSFFEPRFGYDFSQVRVHTDSVASETAKALNSRAFTVGQDVVFGQGQYSPGTAEGRNLLAHELTHVVQQNNSAIVDPELQTRPGPRSVKNTLQRKIVVQGETYVPALPAESLAILPPKQRRALEKAQERTQAEKGFKAFINSLLQEGINRSARFKELYIALHLDKKNRTLLIKPGATYWGGEVNRMAFSDRTNTIIVDMLKIVYYDRIFGKSRDAHISTLGHELEHAYQYWFHRKAWEEARRERTRKIKEIEAEKGRKLTMAEKHELDPEEQRVKRMTQIIANQLKKNPKPRTVLITIGPELDSTIAEVERLRKRLTGMREEFEKERAYWRAMKAYRLYKEAQMRKRHLIEERKRALDELDPKLREIGEKLEKIWE